MSRCRLSYEEFKALAENIFSTVDERVLRELYSRYLKELRKEGRND